MQRPVYGPHDEELPVRDWFDITLARVADDEAEKEEWSQMARVWRSKYKCKDVGGLMNLSQEQLEQAAMEAVGLDGAKGTVREVLKYLGAKQCPHKPPPPTVSDGMHSLSHRGDKAVLFGRPGKTGRNSSEHNFPLAMEPSRLFQNIETDAIALPRTLKSWVEECASLYSTRHLMPQHETSRISRAVADWIVSIFGVSPVSPQTEVSASSNFLRSHDCLCFCTTSGSRWMTSWRVWCLVQLEILVLLRSPGRKS
mmetsp:Transcript_4593/g.7015  ORF Transcript_4593/g.7015 Transcript_4593/m.7015 type:complete len:254 (-) Transcript_4593:2064-2825(-)